MSRYFLEKDSGFIIEEYNRSSPFANFLPAISGIWGIPLWCFYVNRAQGVVSFGIKDKSHSILEFLPADKAYQQVGRIGFRTFVKVNGTFYEPFQLTFSYPKKEKMIIKSSELTLEESNFYLGINISVDYFTLPSMPFASLVRILRIENISKKEYRLEILDGLPKIIPFGCRDLFLKHLSRTLEAWMKSEITDIASKRIALFRLTVDPKDTSHTHYIEGANFFLSFTKDKIIRSLPLIIDPRDVFLYDTSYSLPFKFLRRNFAVPQRYKLYGRSPSAFCFLRTKLVPQEKVTIYTLVGGVFNLDILSKNIGSIDDSLLEKKKEEGAKLIEKIKDNAWCLSSSYEFNEYLKSTYLDNILRGGYPYKFGRKKIYYLFSRKHGDLERDYNKFKILPTYFSEGEGNYRDINQNRRMDLFFNPTIYDKNIIYFLNLLRIDGYNPLVVKGEKLYFEKKSSIEDILRRFSLPLDNSLISLMKRGFYLGEFFTFLRDKKINLKAWEELVSALLERAKTEPQAKFGEGFWIDHWHYNLDLIESFLYFYPDKVSELFLKTNFMFWDDEVRVKERKYRYFLKDGKVYQLNSLELVEEKKKMISMRRRLRNFLRTAYGRGKVYKTNLVEKLLSIILNKLSSLDFRGIGIEMEADKPGWCDSLNGLPALFGSSLCETLETKRACMILGEAIKKIKRETKKVRVCKEIRWFFDRVEDLFLSYRERKIDRELFWWDKSNQIKEAFRRKTFWGLEGKQESLSLERIGKFLKESINKLNLGIAKGKDKKSGLYFTYFLHEIKEYQNVSYIKPKKVISKPLPLFLEGCVHILRVNKEKQIYQKVKKTALFDRKLKMYRLNLSLDSSPLEVGRSKVFPSGWLENESIWLHMEYKYLVELIKNGLYDEFYNDFFRCVICFMEPRIYGRSILENSSFIVSSAYYDSNLWGKGFVARLTGATSELLNIWVLMCLGRQPFFIDHQDKLFLKFSPLLKESLFTTKKSIFNLGGERIVLPPNVFAFKLFSSTLVVYHNPKRIDTYSPRARVERIEIDDGKRVYSLKKDIITPPLSYKIREQVVRRIDIYFTTT